MKTTMKAAYNVIMKSNYRVIIIMISSLSRHFEIISFYFKVSVILTFNKSNFKMIYTRKDMHMKMWTASSIKNSVNLCL